MKAGLIRSIALAALAIAGLYAIVHPSTLRRAAAAHLQQPGLPLTVMFDPTDLDANTQQLYQTMQDSISGYAVTPNVRTAYYTTVNNANGYVVNDWCGLITNVQPNANGYLVSVDVVPSLSGNTVACGVIVDSDYSEQYQVFADGTFQYVGSLDPQGTSGQMFTIIGL